jgi:activator of 2-hydroxyglutaryl-CoA dehydratase
MTATLVGIDVGSTNVKACVLRPGGERLVRIVAHEGDLRAALERACRELRLDVGDADVSAVVTGTEGRRRIRLPRVIAPKRAFRRWASRRRR